MRTLTLFLALLIPWAASAADFPDKVVCLKAPRDPAVPTSLPDFLVQYDIPAGTKLVLLDITRNADGTYSHAERTLAEPSPGRGITDPRMSVNGRHVYYCDMLPGSAPTHPPQGRIMRVAIEGGEPVVVRDMGPTYVTSAPCPLPDGSLVFAELKYDPGQWRSSDILSMHRTRLLRKNLTTGKTVVINGWAKHAQHPVLSPNGMILFGCEEAFGTRDNRLNGLWHSTPDGVAPESVLPALMTHPNGWHYHCAVPGANGARAYCTLYYNLNQGGFGGMYSCSQYPQVGPPQVDESSDGFFQAFAPEDMKLLTRWEVGLEDGTSEKYPDGRWMGKVSHPSCANPDGDVLMTWGAGPVSLRYDETTPSLHGHVALLRHGQSPTHPEERDVAGRRKMEILATPPEDGSYLMPQAAVAMKDMFDKVPTLPYSNLDPDADGYWTFCSSSLNRAEVKGMNRHRANLDGGPTNYVYQGAAKPDYQDEDIAALRIVALGLPKVISTQWTSEQTPIRTGLNHQERMYVLGEFPVRKPGTDAEGGPNNGFAVRVPHDLVITLQKLDDQGRAISTAVVRHGGIEGEARDCRGCHTHHVMQPEFQLPEGVPFLASRIPVDADLTNATPQLVEFRRDVKPILARLALEFTPAECKVLRSWDSPLIVRLEAAGATAEELRTVATWIDTGMATAERDGLDFALYPPDRTASAIDSAPCPEPIVPDPPTEPEDTVADRLRAVVQEIEEVIQDVE